MNKEIHNSQNELLKIQEITSGRFKGRHLLVIVDNNETGTKAMHLLDGVTKEFLLQALNDIT